MNMHTTHLILFLASALTVLAAPPTRRPTPRIPAAFTGDDLIIKRDGQECYGGGGTCNAGMSGTSGGCDNPEYPYCVCENTAESGFSESTVYYTCSNVNQAVEA